MCFFCECVFFSSIRLGPSSAQLQSICKQQSRQFLICECRCCWIEIEIEIISLEATHTQYTGISGWINIWTEWERFNWETEQWVRHKRRTLYLLFNYESAFSSLFAVLILHTICILASLRCDWAFRVSFILQSTLRKSKSWISFTGFFW